LSSAKQRSNHETDEHRGAVATGDQKLSAEVLHVMQNVVDVIAPRQASQLDFRKAR
jgi:hypothetical protein